MKALTSALKVGLGLLIAASLEGTALAEAVVFDADLTQGRAAFKGKARGGRWEKGWIVTDNDQRLVWDAGYPVKNGLFEFWLTTDFAPAAPVMMNRGKLDRPDVHYAGVSGVPKLETMEKHVVALRLGQLKTGEGKGHGFSKVVVLGKNNKVDTEKTEKPLGDYAAWLAAADGQSVVRVAIEWKDGVASLVLPDGRKEACPTSKGQGPEVRISDLRYAWLGGIDVERKLTFPGMRFLRARLVDLDKPGTVARVEMPKSVSPMTGGAATK
jgi:hypothetical protein